MDIDGSEWRILPQLLKNGHFDTVLQFAIEIHAMDIMKIKDNAKVY